MKWKASTPTTPPGRCILERSWGDINAIARRKADAVVGHLEGFRLAFNKISISNPPRAANIEYVGGDSRCPAVAWPLSADEVHWLDVKEGATGKEGKFEYYRIGLPFATSTGTLLCHVYIANPDRMQPPAPPSPGYLDHIRKGYEDFGLDSRPLEEALARALRPGSPALGGEG